MSYHARHAPLTRRARAALHALGVVEWARPDQLSVVQLFIVDVTSTACPDIVALAGDHSRLLCILKTTHGQCTPPDPAGLVSEGGGVIKLRTVGSLTIPIAGIEKGWNCGNDNNSSRTGAVVNCTIL